MTEAFKIPVSLNLGQIMDFVTSPSFQTLQMALVIYGGLLWLAVIVWVTRDAINRSSSLLFQVFAILLNLLFPILGLLLYLIIRPCKTTVERYYEELEHKLILESIKEKNEMSEEALIPKPPRKKIVRKSVKRTSVDAENEISPAAHASETLNS